MRFTRFSTGANLDPLVAVAVQLQCWDCYCGAVHSTPPFMRLIVTEALVLYAFRGTASHAVHFIGFIYIWIRKCFCVQTQWGMGPVCFDPLPLAPNSVQVLESTYVPVLVKVQLLCDFPMCL